jgi:anti-sigma factor RsiW
MTCRNARDLLQQSLDGTPVESPEWLAHLQQCPECRALASASRRLQDGLRLLSAPLPPPDLAERIVERVLLDRRRARRRLRRRWAIGVALAAGLLLALTLRLNWRGSPTGSDGASLGPVAKKAPGGNEQTVPTLRQSAAELGAFFVELGNETAQETVGQTRRLVSNVPSPLWDGFQIRPTLEPPTHPLREAGEGLSEGLEPVTTSARRAVDLFLRELSMESKTN